jgi:hypothetical protein
MLGQREPLPSHLGLPVLLVLEADLEWLLLVLVEAHPLRVLPLPELLREAPPQLEVLLEAPHLLPCLASVPVEPELEALAVSGPVRSDSSVPGDRP